MTQVPVGGKRTSKMRTFEFVSFDWLMISSSTVFLVACSVSVMCWVLSPFSSWSSALSQNSLRTSTWYRSMDDG
jgi:hypothetical protein